jgi:hypothetical protein
MKDREKLEPEELEEHRQEEFHLLKKLKERLKERQKELEELEEHRRRLEEHEKRRYMYSDHFLWEKLEELQRELDLLEKLEKRMKEWGKPKKHERRELYFLKELKYLKKEDLCKAGHIFRYYLLSGKTQFDNLESEPFDELKGYYRRQNLFKI